MLMEVDHQEDDRSLEKFLKEVQDLSVPTGQQNFKQMVISTEIFIDKTLFIFFLLKHAVFYQQKTFIITRPRRWGKSMLLSMLYYFFTLQSESGINYKTLFEGGLIQYGEERKMLKALKISSEVEYLQKYQGKHPVIMMKWNEIPYRSFKDFFQGMKTQICLQFLKFKDVLKILEDLKENSKIQLYCQFLKKEVNQTWLIKGIEFLSQCLFLCYKRRVVLLIDEYDYVYHHMLQEDVLPDERKKTSIFLTQILECAFKNNVSNLLCGIAVGIYDILTLSQSGLNSTKVDTLVQPFFVEQSLGFRRQQIQSQLIDKMFKKEYYQNHKLKMKKKKIMKNIDQWYNGYWFSYVDRKNQKTIQIKLYNPYSVINYLTYRCIKPRMILTPISYWPETGSNDIIKSVFSTAYNQKVCGKMFQLISSNIQDSNIQLVQFAYPRKTNLSTIGNQSSNNMHEKQISYMLLHTGYITGYLIDDNLNAKLVNREVYQIYSQLLKEWIKQKQSSVMIKLIDLTDPKSVEESMYNIYNFFKDKLGDMNERSFNGLFYVGYILSNKSTHVVNSALCTDPNFVDHIYYPKTKDKRPEDISDAVIIHEFKYQKNSSRMQQKSQNALWQIFQKKYMKLPVSEWNQKSNIKRIIVRGITVVENRKQGERNLIINMSPDQVFSINEATTIVMFFQNKVNQILLQRLKAIFFRDLKKFFSKNLLYDIIIKEFTEEQQKLQITRIEAQKIRNSHMVVTHNTLIKPKKTKEEIMKLGNDLMEGYREEVESYTQEKVQQMKKTFNK